MKKFYIYIILMVAIFSIGFAYNYGGLNYPVPRNNYVNDYADILNSESENRIWKRLENLEKNSGLEMTIVTIKTLKEFAPPSTTIEEYATGLFNNWGVGNRSNNKGVMILVISEDKMCKIELGAGYSTRYDKAMKGIIEEVLIPNFRAGSYEQGVENGIEEIIKSVTVKVGFLKYYFTELLLVTIVIICILAGISCIKSGRDGWGWTFFGIAFAALGFLVYRILFRTSSSSSFGGGYSSGGGASGSW